MSLGEKLNQIYACPDITKYQERIDSLIKRLGSDDVFVYSVAGRIEVGGNHTDHQLGKVLCASINLDTLAACEKTDNNIITIKSEGYDEIVVDITNTDMVETEKNTTIALVKGVCNKLKEKGYIVGGFNAVVTSDVLTGSGMSSSASFEGLLGVVLNDFYCHNEVELVEIAKIGQYAENVYFGKPSGLMDQIACVMGGFVYIDFYDKENPIIETIDSTFLSEKYDVCIVDTGDSHDDLTHEYADITVEMGKVAGFFNETYLSRVDENLFYRSIKKIKNEFGDRAVLRAMHYFDDNRHVELQRTALKNQDIDTFLALVLASGRSSITQLQNIYSATEPSVQGASLILALCKKILGNHGAYRIHGGGFGGTVQAFVPKVLTKTFKEEIEAIMGQGACHVVSVRSISATKI